MKKMLSMLAIAAIAVGCSKSDSEEVASDGTKKDVISFNPSISLPSTRALIGANELGGSTESENLEVLAPTADGGTFHVVAYKNASTDVYLTANLSAWDNATGNPLFFDANSGGYGESGKAGEGLTGGSYNAGTGEILYYWPLDKDQELDFYAYFVKETIGTAGAPTLSAGTDNYTVYDYTMGATPATQNDVLIAEPVTLSKASADAATDVVPMTFSHAMSMVQFVFASTVKTGYTFKKAEITDYSKGTFDIKDKVDNTTTTGVIVDKTSTQGTITLTADMKPVAYAAANGDKVSTYTAAASAGTLNLADGTAFANANYLTAIAASSALIFPEAAATGLKKSATLYFETTTAAGAMNKAVDLVAPAEGFLPGKVYQYVIKYDGKVIELGAPTVIDWIAVDAGELEC